MTTTIDKLTKIPDPRCVKLRAEAESICIILKTYEPTAVYECISRGLPLVEIASPLWLTDPAVCSGAF